MKHFKHLLWLDFKNDDRDFRNRKINIFSVETNSLSSVHSFHLKWSILIQFPKKLSGELYTNRALKKLIKMNDR